MGRGDELAGWAIYRAADWPVPGAALVVDWLVPPDEREAGALLLQGLKALARADGRAQLFGILPEWSPWFGAFQADGWIAYPGDYVMVGRGGLPRHDVFWLRDHWWYTFNECDLA